MAGIQKPTPSLLRVLAALLKAYDKREWLHGIDVARRARAKHAAVYPMLDKLQENGWIEADWDPPTRPARVRHPLYQLTREGVHAALRLSAEHGRVEPEPGDGPRP
jgi:DNA-binding PadR family transcriptional regulator